MARKSGWREGSISKNSAPRIPADAGANRGKKSATARIREKTPRSRPERPDTKRR